MGARGTFVIVALSLCGAGCNAAIVDDWDRYVATPTSCSVVRPQASDPRAFVQCADDQTCVNATPDGTASTETASCFSTKSVDEGGVCTYASDCAPGLFCAGSYGCVRWCSLDSDDCSEGTTCTAFDDGFAQRDRPIGYCAPPACDPLGSDCDGQCRFHSSTRAGCFAARGKKKRGEACSDSGECGRGLACGAAGVCERLCRIEADDCDGRRCVPSEAQGSLDGVQYGTCAPR